MKTKRKNAIAWAKKGAKRTGKIKRNEWEMILQFKDGEITDTIYADYFFYDEVFKIKHKYRTMFENSNITNFPAKLTSRKFICHLEKHSIKEVDYDQ